MEHDVTDQLERRLGAARPDAADPDRYAIDIALLERLCSQPVSSSPSITRRLAAPAAVGATLTTTAILMLSGGPGDVAGPDSAGAAITQTLHWLSPASHSVLHTKSVETKDGHQTIREFWQSSDDPRVQRERVQGATTFETSGDGIYDPATDTIYAAQKGATSTEDAAADAKKRAVEKAGAPGADDPRLIKADPIVGKVRTLLEDGQMDVRGREMHNGVDAWAISLKQGLDRKVWTLWVSAADGKPLELRDPGDGSAGQTQVIRWDAYEVLPGTEADSLVSLARAHPSARVVSDPAQVTAAEERLVGGKG
ncbi:MAG TPA: hypothetical protein VF066_16620 [Thermoleophilaceae bacterium]